MKKAGAEQDGGAARGFGGRLVGVARRAAALRARAGQKPAPRSGAVRQEASGRPCQLLPPTMSLLLALEHRHTLSDSTPPAALHASVLTRQFGSQPAPWASFPAQHQRYPHGQRPPLAAGATAPRPLSGPGRTPCRSEPAGAYLLRPGRPIGLYRPLVEVVGGPAGQGGRVVP